MMSVNSRVFFVCVLFAFISCQKSNLEELDLLTYGMPITIEAPEGAEVESENYSFQKTLQIKGEGDYDMVVSQSEVYSTVEESMNNLKRHTQENPYFTEFVREDKDGYIYKLVVDSTYVNYNFRHVKQFGSQEYIFQAGFVQQFEKSDIEKLYDIAKKAK